MNINQIKIVIEGGMVSGIYADDPTLIETTIDDRDSVDGDEDVVSIFQEEVRPMSEYSENN